jgi:hypothetical protein
MGVSKVLFFPGRKGASKKKTKKQLYKVKNYPRLLLYLF